MRLARRQILSGCRVVCDGRGVDRSVVCDGRSVVCDGRAGRALQLALFVTHPAGLT
jgi:hypothetical protein